MSLALTPAQTAQLQALRSAGQYAGAYELMEIWTRDSADPDVQLVHTWLLGAADINRGEGPFAALVKAYNQRQGLLRGRPVSDADNQGASNYIAQKVIDYTVGNSSIPDFAEIVKYDAEGGKFLYAYLADEGDSAKANGANWTGTFLISPFGFDQTFRLTKTGISDTAMDTLDDAKNVLFAYDAFQTALRYTVTSSALAGTNGPGAVLNLLFQAYPAISTLPEKDRLLDLSLITGFPDSYITSLMRGRSAENAFTTVNFLDKYDFLDHLMSAWQGKVVAGTSDDAFLSTAANFFADISDGNTLRDTNLEWLGNKNAAELATLAKSDAKYLSALASLSAIALDLDANQYAARGLAAGSAEAAQHSDRWIADRAAMLELKLKFDSGQQDENDLPFPGDKSYSDNWDDSTTTGNWDFVDLGTFIDGEPLKLAIDGTDISLHDHQIVFGTKNGETLEGRGDSDRLYGMSGDDILIGGKGNDHMEGGEGFDTYRIAPEDGNDVILDTDGKGVIVYNGLTLGDGQSIAPNQWQNALGHTYTLIETGMTRDLLIHAGSEQILVKNHQDGNLGIRLLGDEAPESFSQSAGGITVVGDRRPYQMSWDYWLWVNNPTWPYLFDVNGNMVRTNVPQPFYSDKIFDTAGDDNIYAGDGLNVIYAYNGGNNRVQTGANSDYILGGAGRERIFSGGMTDTIDAGGGDDIVYGEGGRDVIEGGAGNDFLSGGEGADAIHGGEGDDRIYGREAMTWDQALTDSGIASQEQGELLAGGAGNDVVVGDAGSDALLGGEGDDMISGREGDDIILGDSTLTFVVPPLSMFDSIIGATRWPMGPYLDFHSPFSTAPMLGIRFERIDRGPDSVDRYESRLSSLGSPEAALENWIVPAMAGGNDQLHGGTGDDWLFGEFGNDILDGGAGNDYLNGGTGDDIYLFGHGSGQDTVFDHDEAPGNVDTILMADGVVASDVEVSRDRFNLYLSLGGGVDGLTLSHWFRADAYKIERVVFADGVTWNAADLQSMAGGLPVAGSDADDSLDGSDDNDEIRGFAGSDTLSGGMGDDRLEGGRDADTLAGGDGTDTYHFNPGDGMDEVRDSLSGGANVLSFSEGIAREHLRLEEDAAGLLLHYGDGDTIRLPGAGRSDPVFGQVLLADGTTFDFVELFANRAPSVGTPLPTSLVADEDAPFSFIPPGDAFNDPDGDSLTFDATLADGSPLPDWLTFDAATGTLSGTPDNGDVGQLLLRFGATDTEGESAFQEMTLTVLNVNDAPLATHSLPDQQAQGGKTWSYTLPEGSFADEDAGDVLNYRANLADGSDLPDWLTFDTGTRTLSGTSPLGTDGSLTVRITAADRAGAQAQSTFALAVNPGLPRVQGNEGVDILAAGSSGTLLQGLGGNDILLGRSGNDILDGGRGNDLLTGGSGSDTYRFGRGDGHDRIVELDLRDKDTDRLVFGEDIAADQLWFQRKGLDLDIGVIGTADHATVTGWYLSSRLRVDEFQTSNGAVLLDSQVQALVDAMAAFAPPRPGENTLPENYREALAPVIAANWQ